MSEFTLYMMLIFLPGIIAYKVFDQLTEHREHKIHEIIIYSFIFALFSYLTYYIFFNVFSLIFDCQFKFYLLDTLKDFQNINFIEIFIVTFPFAVFVGIGTAVCDTYKTFHRIACALKITRKHGELDTFSFLMNSNLHDKVWVIVRDAEDDFAYFGWINSYSAGHERNELFLVDVEVYNNSTGIKLMDARGIYLSKPKEKYIIEFPTL